MPLSPLRKSKALPWFHCFRAAAATVLGAGLLSLFLSWPYAGASLVGLAILAGMLLLPVLAFAIRFAVAKQWSQAAHSFALLLLLILLLFAPPNLIE